MGKIKILYVGAGPLINRGVEKYITQVVEKIDVNRFQIDVFTPNDCRSDYFRSIIESNGGKIIEGHGRESHIFREIDYYKTLCEYLTNNSYDIIEIQSGSILFLGLGIKASNKCAVSGIIAHTHNTQNNPLKASIKKALIYRSLNNAHLYFACSEKAAYETFPRSIAAKAKVINDAIDISRFTYSAKERKQVRQAFGVNDTTTVFGCVGAFTEQKNHMFLLDVFKEICTLNSDSVLWLFGDGQLRKKIEKKIQCFGLQKKVVLFGNRSDVNKFYQGMDCCIIPSLFEGLCIVAVEAQAAGLPVVAADTLPDNVKLTDIISFVSLKENPSDWAKKCIASSQAKNRKDTNMEIRKAGYDIDTMVQSLAKEYSLLYKRIMHTGKDVL